MADRNHTISYQFALQHFGAAGRFCMDMDGLSTLVDSAKFPTQQSSFVSDNASVYYVHTCCSLEL
jgi:hypothetical protein